jgi:O-antigen ligase
MRPATISEGGTARLSSAKGSRSDHYRVALDGLRAHPLWGDGAGGFEVRWMRERRVPIRVRNAHSLYHETLGELGLIGAGLLLLFLASLVAAAIRSRLRPRSLSRSQSAAVAAACSVWLVHSGFDWDWQVPALTGTALVLAATLFPYGRRSDGPENGNSPPDASAASTGVSAG